MEVTSAVCVRQRHERIRWHADPPHTNLIQLNRRSAPALTNAVSSHAGQVTTAAMASTRMIVVAAGYARGLTTARVNLEEGSECARIFDVFGSSLLQDRRSPFYDLLMSTTVV